MPCSIVWFVFLFKQAKILLVYIHAFSGCGTSNISYAWLVITHIQNSLLEHLLGQDKTKINKTSKKQHGDWLMEMQWYAVCSLKSLLKIKLGADYVQVVLDRHQSPAKLMTLSAAPVVTLWSYGWPVVGFFPLLCL